MDPKALVAKAIEDDELDWVGLSITERFVEILYKKGKAITKLPVDSVAGLDWEIIRAVITGEKAFKMIKHVTRVVGYYSVVENWNASKIAELEDRRKGEYKT